MADWVDEATAILARLPEAHHEKRRATILALVRARLEGRTEESVWSEPGVVSRKIYHHKWKKEPVFASVLSEVTALARGWRDGASMRALRSAAERLALASPVAAAKLIRLMDNDDPGVVHRAAVAILDRAGMETAAKSEASVESAGTVRIEISYSDTDDQSDAAAAT